MGIPFSRWGACPFIVHPFRYPEAACHDIEARPDHETTSEPGILNPVRLALEWQAMLARDNALTKATIARNMGLSRARVTQIMNLLDLPKSIISVIAGLQKPAQIRIVSERKLRAMLELTSKPAQRRAFALLQAELTRAS